MQEQRKYPYLYLCDFMRWGRGCVPFLDVLPCEYP